MRSSPAVRRTRSPPIATICGPCQVSVSTGFGDLELNWFWPRKLNADDRLTVRVVRLLHWCVVGFALFGLVVSLIALIEAGDPEPIAIFTIIFMWAALALLARGFRYLIARE